MQKVSQKAIRNMIASGAAKNLEEYYHGDCQAFNKFISGLDLYRTHYSAGTYGVNGSVWLDKDGGTWAVASRSTVLMMLV